MEHIFDESSMVYGSETGNWFGRCVYCGIELIVYTGAADLRSIGAHAEERIHSNGREPEGSTMLECNFEEFVKGHPNMLIKYPACTK